jgi:signal transduction histidine kinase
MQLEHIGNASKQAFLLVENLLLWAQSQNRSIAFHPEQINITAHILKNISIVKSQADQQGVIVTTSIKKEYFVPGDKNMVDTIIRNLLSNAVQFTPDKGKVVVSARRKGNHLEISVKDNGIGIEKDDLESIFKIETQVRISSTAGKQGSGLGLILCKEFVERHGGKIWAESEFGKGSTFRFTIPFVSNDVNFNPGSSSETF